MSTKAKVGLARGADRRQNVWGALELVRDQVEPKLAEQVLLKPNFLSSENQLASTHADAIRGAIDFVLSAGTPPREILVAEGGNESYSGEAFDNFGYRQLDGEYPVPVRLIDLNQEKNWTATTIFSADGSPVSVRMPQVVLDCPCTISLAVAKTHDVCVVTLALKNMIMGTLHKDDRIQMHGYPSHPERILPREAQVLNVNLMRVARYLTPDIGVIDGTVGLQGNGPGGTDRVDLAAAVAGADVFAADAVMGAAMGFDPAGLGLCRYAEELGVGIADLARIEVLGSSIEAVRQAFTPHETTELQLQWAEERAGELLAAS